VHLAKCPQFFDLCDQTCLSSDVVSNVGCPLRCKKPIDFVDFSTSPRDSKQRLCPEMYKRSSTKLLVMELTEILGVSQGTVRTWAADGKIPVHRETTERHTGRTVTRNSALVEED